jgi:aspartate kinase
LTAIAISAALSVDGIHVWKDVDVIPTTDPRLVPNAMPVSRVRLQEASESVYFGAQVLHPIAMQPALAADIPVKVSKNCM